MFGSVNTAVGSTSAAGDPRQPLAPSAPRCRRRGSARRRSPSASRASRRRCSRATAPRRRRTSRSSTCPAPPYSSGMVRPNTPSAPISSTISSGISSSVRCQPWAKRHDLARRRSGGTGRGPSRSPRRGRWRRSWRCPRPRPSARRAARARRRCCRRRRAPRPRACARRVGGRGRRRAGRTISTCDIGMPPASWREVLAEGDLQDQPLGLAEAARRRRAARPAGDLAQRLGIGRHPGEAVRRRLRRPRAPRPRPARRAMTRAASTSRAAATRARGVGGRGLAERQQVGEERRLGRQATAASVIGASRGSIVRRRIGMLRLRDARAKSPRATTAQHSFDRRSAACKIISVAAPAARPATRAANARDSNASSPTTAPPRRSERRWRSPPAASPRASSASRCR